MGSFGEAAIWEDVHIEMGALVKVVVHKLVVVVEVFGVGADVFFLAEVDHSLLVLDFDVLLLAKLGTFQEGLLLDQVGGLLSLHVYGLLLDHDRHVEPQGQLVGGVNVAGVDPAVEYPGMERVEESVEVPKALALVAVVNMGFEEQPHEQPRLDALAQDV